MGGGVGAGSRVGSVGNGGGDGSGSALPRFPCDHRTGKGGEMNYSITKDLNGTDYVFSCECEVEDAGPVGRSDTLYLLRIEWRGLDVTDFILDINYDFFEELQDACTKLYDKESRTPEEEDTRD
jgi:hypothetical protein